MTPEQQNRPSLSPAGSSPPGPSTQGQPPTVIIQQPRRRRLKTWILASLLVSSLMANFVMYSEYKDYFSSVEGPGEKYHSGDRHADDKLAIIKVSGMIMPPFSDRVVKAIKKAKEDKTVKGVLLAVDSPGGTVTDSHRIYHKLKELSAEKPVVVSMGSLAASGGY